MSNKYECKISKNFEKYYMRAACPGQEVMKSPWLNQRISICFVKIIKAEDLHELALNYKSLFHSEKGNYRNKNYILLQIT